MPRTLVFLERDEHWLFLRGGPSKWFAGQLNALGGGVEPGEDVEAAAIREVREECGLTPRNVRLAGTVHVEADPQVLLFVFRAQLPPGEVVLGTEGELIWLARQEVEAGQLPFLEDVAALFAAIQDPQVFHRTSRP